METTTKTVKLTGKGLSALEAKLSKLNARAKRLGVPGVSVARTTDWELVTTETDRYQIATFEISTTVPRLAGWSFVCRIQHEEHGNLLAVAPKAPAIDLTAFRTCKSNCDHCNTFRRRIDTFVIANECGKVMQIGRDCLAAVLGLGGTPEQAIAWAEWIQSVDWTSLGESENSGGEGHGSGAAQTHAPLAMICGFAECVIKAYGYRSKKSVEALNAAGGNENSTASEVIYQMFPPRGLTTKERAALLTPTDADNAFAKEAIAWALTREVKTDFDHNMRVLARSESCDLRNVGTAAFIVEGYRRHLGYEAKRKALSDSLPPSEHVGELGKRIKGEVLTYVATPFSTDTQFGVLFIHKFRTKSGSDIVWKTSTEMTETPGTELEAAFTPKEHGEFNGRKQTVVSRLAFK